MVTLSVCLIVKNEEAHIKDCLNSIKGADEIIVLDTGSDDKTCEIARQFFIENPEQLFRVIENSYKWEDSFCKARNKVLSFSDGDWILSIDADETLEEGGIEKIRQEIEKVKEKAKTINIKLLSKRGKDVHYFPRVFKRCPEVYWCGAIHNYLNVSEQNNTDIKIYYGYSEAHKKDPDRAFRILKKEVDANPKCTREKFYLAREYWYRRNYQKAIDIYNEYLKVAYWAPEISEAHMVKGRCLMGLGKYDKAKDSLLQAIKINSNFKEAIILLAKICGPGNMKRWNGFAETATNEGVLFVRT